MTLRDSRPQIVVILDLPGTDPGGLGIRERIAACYRFARHNGLHVAEVCDASDRTYHDEFERAVAICKHTGAGLLVYRVESITRRALGSTKGLGVIALAERAMT
jgi:hypothetical protein